MPQFETITLEVSEGIAVITLNRPDLNPFEVRMMHELVTAFDLTDADDAVRAVILTGAGQRAFCAGADLSSGTDTFDYDEQDEARQAPRSAKGENRDGGGIVTLRMFDSLKPVIAAVNGAAVGVGATMLLAADYRIAVPRARFGFVFNLRGIAPESASAWFLPRLVGLPTALRWCYTGALVGAEEALAAGLVQAVHEPADLLPAARALAHQFTAASAPVSIALTRQLMWRMQGAAHPMDAHRHDSRAVHARGAQADAREGISSFLEKRAAVFPDRVSADLPDIWQGWHAPTFDP